MKKEIYLTIFCFLFITNFVSASSLGSYKPQKVGEEFNFSQTCEDSTYITLSTIITPNGTEIVNSPMTSVGGGAFVYNYTPSQVGRYDFTGISDGCLKTFAVYVDVTPNGKTYETSDSLIHIAIAIFFVLVMLGFYKVSKSLNYEKWYEKIKNKYITRNFVKWSLGAIAYNIMINSFIVYFLLGLPIVLILVDLVFIYNITGVEIYVNSLLYVYISLVVVLGVVFLSFVQEWFMDFIEMAKRINWGVENNE